MSMWVLMMKGCILILVPTIPLLLPILRAKVGVKKGKVRIFVVMTVMRQTLMIKPLMMK
jgi:hypothetical protein